VAIPQAKYLLHGMFCQEIAFDSLMVDRVAIHAARFRHITYPRKSLLRIGSGLCYGRPITPVQLVGTRGAFMKPARFRAIKIQWPAIVLVFAFFAWNSFAGTVPGLNEPLNEAAERGDLALVKILLDKGADINAKAATVGCRLCPWTALIVAANAGHVEVVRLLLEKGADIRATDHTGWTALVRATNSGRLGVVRLLIEKGADVNAEDGLNGNTILMHAASQGHLEVVKLLIEKGADVNAKPSFSNGTALDQAAEAGHLEVVKLLLDKGADVNAEDSDALTRALYNGHGDVVKLLETHGAEWTLIRAVMLGDVKEVQQLIEGGADVNEQEDSEGTVLMMAASRKDIEVVKVLLANGADINAKSKDGRTALMAAAYGDAKITKLLLDRGADVRTKTEDGHTALLSAVMAGSADAVKMLLDKGADVNALSESNMSSETCLMHAAGSGQEAIVKLLLENGADVNAKTKHGGTALLPACNSGQVEIVKMLLDKGADVNSGGGTALLYASEKGHTDVVKMLLDKGAEVNTQAKDGNTAILYAAMAGSADIVKMLLGKRADANTKNKHGMTALREAEIRNDYEIVQLLKQAGAKNGQPATNGTASHVTPVRARAMYPDTPEGVVKAFINEALEDGPITVEEMRSCNEILLVQNKYFLKDREITPGSENEDLDQEPPELPFRFDIAQGFEIKEVNTSDKRATVKVIYRRLGWIWDYPLGRSEECHSAESIKDKRTTNLSGPLGATTKIAGNETSGVVDKDECRFLNVSNDTQEETYNLAKPGKFWRIIRSDEHYISVGSAIKRLECKTRKLASKEQKLEIKQDIKILEQHLGR
jgi:ankyrin repeat protein